MLAERTLQPTVLLDLIDHLSPGASLWRALDPDALWALEPMLLALLVDELRVLRWEFERAHFTGRRPPPEPLPRPGVAARAGDRDRHTVGAGTGFDTLADFDRWYAARRTDHRAPEPATDASTGPTTTTDGTTAVAARRHDEGVPRGATPR